MAFIDKIYTGVWRHKESIICKQRIDGVAYFDKRDTYPFDFYIESAQGKHKSLYGNSLDKETHMASPAEASAVFYQNKQEWGNATEKRLYGMDDVVYQYLSKEFPHDLSLQNHHLKICSFDIEVDIGDEFPTPDKAEYPINCIASVIKTNEYTKTICYTTIKGVRGEDITYVETEDEMLKRFCDDLKEHDIDVLTGWNTKLFDIPYMVHRMQKLFPYRGFEDNLSPIHNLFTNAKGLLTKKTDRETGESYYEIAGIMHLDYMELYKKYTREKKPSYRLDAIANDELGEGKHDFSAYGNSIKKFFDSNKQAFVEYNIQDTLLVHKLNEKLKYIELAYIISFFAKAKPDDVFAVTRIWDAFIYNYLKEDGIVIPPKLQKEKTPYEGAYVRPVEPNKYQWVVSFDLTSMYPMIIRQLGISPETLVNKASKDKDRIKEEMILMQETSEIQQARDKNYALAANGTMYKKDIEGVIPRAVAFVFDQRVNYKNQMKEWQRERERIIKEFDKRGMKYE